MARRLTAMDEWPRHQTLDTFDTVASDSPQWSDGSWICVGDAAGACHLITALRFYANTNVVDGYAIVSLDDGRQYNLRVSRRLRPDTDHLRCGPLWMEIVEGLRTLRFGCHDNTSGITFDLRWDGAGACFDESPGVVTRQDGRITRARSNYVQVGDVSGTITVQGRRFDVGAGWVGARDHSWGIGDTGTGNLPGPAAPAGALGADAPRPGAALRAFGLRQYSFVRFADRTLFSRFHCAPDGTMSNVVNRVEYAIDSGRDGWSYTGFEVESVEFAGRLRRVERSVVRCIRPDGAVDRYAIRRAGPPVYMQGGGYWDGFDDGRGRGVYRGDDVIEHDVWDISHPTIVRSLAGDVLPQRNGAWAETIAVWEHLDDPTDIGIGEWEAVVGGPYPGVDD